MDLSARLNAGLAKHREGQLGEAIVLYRQILDQQSLSAEPDDRTVLYLLGTALHQNGDNQQSLPVIRRAIAAMPDDSRCLNVLGLVLGALGNDSEAVAAFRTAVELDGSPDAQQNLTALLNKWCDLGDLRAREGALPQAMAAYGTALQLDESFSRAWYATGTIHSGRKDYALAKDCFWRALGSAPAWKEAQHNFAQCLFELGKVDDALEWFARAADGANPEMPLSMIAVTAPGVPSADNQTILEARRNWAVRYHKRADTRDRPARRRQTDRPRVGYLSSFFQRDNWMKPVWTLINHHARYHFEIHLFSDCPRTSVQHGYSEDARDVFHDIGGLSNQEAAEQIRRTGLDILVDLNGFSKMSRIGVFAFSPAPIVAAWFNMYATSGSECYDYLIGDCVVIPEAEERFYTERILRVAGSYLTFEINYPVPDVAHRYGNEPFTFGCLAPLYKITPQVIKAWSEILLRAPGSRLLLKNSAFSRAGNRDFVSAEFVKAGVEPARVVLEGPAEHYHFLEAYGRIDLALDTFPYNGGTTTTEAIWQGVPVLTTWGDRWVARTSASLLRAAGLDDFVCSNVDEYIGRGAEMAGSAGHRSRLRDLRRAMREKLLSSEVCNGAAFAKNMERLYRSVCAEDDPKRD